MKKFHRAVRAFSCFALAVLLPPQLARGEDATGLTSKPEASVLVATCDDAAESVPEEEHPPADDLSTLEPISQTAEHAPEIAPTQAVEPDGNDFGRALNKASHEHAAAAQPTVQAAARQASGTRAAASYEPVKFQGILVGKSTRQQLVTGWGTPDKSVTTPEGDVLQYEIHPFESVEALVHGDVVAAIKIALATPLEAKQLAKQLSLDSIRPAVALDEDDQKLGLAFPERGVVFMFDAFGSTVAQNGESSHTVSHVVVQPIDARAFAMRAENNMRGPYAQNISDLKTAIALDPDFAHAHYLLAKLYLATGQANAADAAAADACEIDPNSAAYQVCRGQTQELLGEYDKAVLTTRAVLDRENIAPIDKAAALHQMARLASLGDVEIASKAISFHTRAIELADTVATSSNSKERRAAKQLLVEAHVAVAEEIARQTYNEKLQSLSLWLGRASGLAEDFIASDGGSVELRLLIAQRALSALGHLRPSLDPAPWIAEAEEAARALESQRDDETWQARVRWELGIAYLHALRVEHVRRETAAALKYGQLAVDYLADGAASRQAVHSSEQLVGNLYFQMGAVHAVHELDHAKAALWYDKAEPLLTGPRPVSELYSPRREGEMLVSMGVTHWQLGEHQRALQLTQSGVNLVEMAVEDGVLAKSTLAVPYGNLAAMYKQLGENTAAAKYTQLAKTVAPEDAERAPRVGRTPSAQPRTPVMQTGAQQTRQQALRR